jgi:hypothetical protein
MIHPGIAAFWSWWPLARARIETAIDTGEWDEITQEIGERVNAIDAGLDYELCPGIEARHAFCLSSRGESALRAIAERWRKAAPPHDEIWEFHPARQPRPDFHLEIDGYSVRPEDLQVAYQINEDREYVDVGIHHPKFREMSEKLRGMIVFLMLDGALGEDGVERWVGGIEVLEEAPEEPAAMRDLIGAVEDLSRAATGERFAVLRGEDEDGFPRIATVNLALKRIEHLLINDRVEVDVALRSPNDVGFPTQKEADELNALEDELAQSLPESAVYAGRETHRGVRRLHFFVDPSAAAAGALNAFAAAHPERRIVFRWEEDPQWQLLRRWR